MSHGKFLALFHPTFVHFRIWFYWNFDTVTWHKIGSLSNCANLSLFYLENSNSKTRKSYAEKLGWFFQCEKHKKITTKILTCALNTSNAGEILQKTEWETAMWFCFIYNIHFFVFRPVWCTCAHGERNVSLYLSCTAHERIYVDRHSVLCFGCL